MDAARDMKLPIHLHVSEEDVQVEKAREETGLTPFGILDRAGGFDCPVLVGHGLWIEEEDLKFLKEDTWFAFCPKTYLKLASGKGGFFDYYKSLNFRFWNGRGSQLQYLKSGGTGQTVCPAWKNIRTGIPQSTRRRRSGSI